MPHRVWIRQRGREYELLRQSLERRGDTEGTAREIGARNDTIKDRSTMTKAELVRAICR
jgi:hypothetical protein